MRRLVRASQVFHLLPAVVAALGTGCLMQSPALHELERADLLAQQASASCASRPDNERATCQFTYEAAHDPLFYKRVAAIEHDRKEALGSGGDRGDPYATAGDASVLREYVSTVDEQERWCRSHPEVDAKGHDACLALAWNDEARGRRRCIAMRARGSSWHKGESLDQCVQSELANDERQRERTAPRHPEVVVDGRYPQAQTQGPSSSQLRAQAIWRGLQSAGADMQAQLSAQQQEFQQQDAQVAQMRAAQNARATNGGGYGSQASQPSPYRSAPSPSYDNDRSTQRASAASDNGSLSGGQATSNTAASSGVTSQATRRDDEQKSIRDRRAKAAESWAQNRQVSPYPFRNGCAYCDDLTQCIAVTQNAIPEGCGGAAIFASQVRVENRCGKSASICVDAPDTDGGFSHYCGRLDAGQTHEFRVCMPTGVVRYGAMSRLDRSIRGCFPDLKGATGSMCSGEN